MADNVKYRVLLVCSHPVQFAAPVFRLMARHPRLDITMAYCSLQGAEPGVDPEFGVKVAWDIPLLDGYHWLQVPNKSLRPGLGRFFGLMNPGLWKLVRQSKFDVAVIYGYAYLSYWIAILAAKSVGVPIIMATDAVSLYSPRGGWWWKQWVKAPAAKLIYRLPNIVLAPSTATRRFLSALGIPEERLALAHYTVDNEFFTRAIAKVDRTSVRQGWNIPSDAFVILYCAKLVPWKRPGDLLRAFRSLCGSQPVMRDSAFLVFAGDGTLRGTLEAEARSLGLAELVRFLGFVNQSELPKVYASSDLLVLPSGHEPWGLVVNEAMACGVPAAVSDRVGARLDLISPGLTGEVYPAGNVENLAGILRRFYQDRASLKHMSEAARKRMETWSYQEHLEGFVRAVERAVQQPR